MKRRTWIAGAAVATVVVLAESREARADLQLASNFDVAVPVDAGAKSFLSTGAGFDVRLGYRFTIPYQHIAITPEIAAGYADLSAHFIRVRPGVKVGFGRIFVPYVFGHIGWGWSSFQPVLPDLKPMPGVVSAQGAAFDVGAGLDLTVTRRFTVGAHIGYNVVHLGETTSSTPTFADPVGPWPKWMTFGLNASLYF